MITIVTTGNETIKFNLKNRDREKLLRDAWYSMSDTPRFGGKELKVTTDLGKKYMWVVRDVKSCVYEDAVFDYTEKPATPPKLRAKKAPEPDLPDELPLPQEAYKDMPSGFGFDSNNMDADTMREFKEAIPYLRDTVQQMLSNIPPESKERAAHFLERLREEGIQLDMNDLMLFSMVAKVMNESECDVETYVETYLKYWANRK